MDPPAFDELFIRSVPHILEKIFFSLDYKSFKICMEVNNIWNDLLTSESFKKIGKSVFREDIKMELCKASDNGNLKEVKSTLSSGMVDVNCIVGPCDGTPLHCASCKGHEDVVNLLLDTGADPNKTDNSRATPLHAAVFYDHEDVAQLLINRGAEVNKEDIHQRTPLHYAVCGGLRDVAKVLLDRGAEPNRANYNGFTSLHYASCFGHKDVVQLLLLRGADLNIATANSSTPLTLALNNGHADIVNILQDEGA